MEGRTPDQEDEERKTSWLGPVHPGHNGLRLVSWLWGGRHADLCAHSCLAQLSAAFLVWVRIWPAACSWVPLQRSGTRGSLENVGLCQASATAGRGSLGMMTREQLPAQLTGALPPREQGESAKDHSTSLSLPLPSQGSSEWTLRPPQGPVCSNHSSSRRQGPLRWSRGRGTKAPLRSGGTWGLDSEGLGPSWTSRAKRRSRVDWETFNVFLASMDNWFLKWNS